MTWSVLATVHAVSTLFMTGVIWFVQVVHYPLMAAVGRTDFRAYEALHQRRTGWVVGPAMLVELAAAIGLVVAASGAAAAQASRLGLALLVVIWVATAAGAMPAHRRLAAGFSAAGLRRLLRVNWVRTAAWSARVPLALVALHA